MKHALALTLLATALLAGCTRDGRGLVDTAQETRWRAVATDEDRTRLRGWRSAWVAALPAARAADSAAIATGGALFDPDRALATPLPPAGAYRCRIHRLGARTADRPAFATLPPAACRIDADRALTRFRVEDGAQRPAGLFYADNESRSVFLGTLALGDERQALAYGLDTRRNLAGYVERIGIDRWRLVLPAPSFDSLIDVIEIVPAQ